MFKRGPKPKKIIETKWSANLAYAVGLLTADGCLVDGRSLIDLTSKDLEQVKNYRKCLGILGVKIGKKSNGGGIKAYRVQFKNVLFYAWLESIGLTKNKSKTLGQLRIPEKFFFDFLRGLFDGDGSTYSYFDKRWRSSFVYYLNFTSASPKFLLWLQSEITRHAGVSGHVTKSAKVEQLRFAKSDALKIIKKMYYSDTVVHLERKKKKIDKTIREDIRNKCASGEIGKHASMRY